MSRYAQKLGTETRGFATAAILLALLLRAVIPTGWMPDRDARDGEIRFVMCGAQGAELVTMGTDGLPHPVDDAGKADQLHAPCVFAALMAPLVPATAPRLVPPAERTNAPLEAALAAAVAGRRFATAAPRGPPLHA